MSTLHTPALFRAPSPGKQKGGRTELKYLLPTGKEEETFEYTSCLARLILMCSTTSHLRQVVQCILSFIQSVPAEKCIDRESTVLELDNYPINLLT